MNIKYVNGQRKEYGRPFVDAVSRTASLAENLAQMQKKTVRATLPNGIRYTVRAK